MRLKLSALFLLILLLAACSRKSEFRELSNPGFGITATEISASEHTVHLPLLLKSSEVIKGIQFTLSWDAAIAKVGQPSINALNPSVSIRTGQNVRGQMKVLVFSMQGDPIDSSDPLLMTLPVSILDKQATELVLNFENPVFAGPQASSYDIPITHGHLKVIR